TGQRPNGLSIARPFVGVGWSATDGSAKSRPVQPPWRASRAVGPAVCSSFLLADIGLGAPAEAAPSVPIAVAEDRAVVRMEAMVDAMPARCRSGGRGERGRAQSGGRNERAGDLAE